MFEERHPVIGILPQSDPCLVKGEEFFPLTPRWEVPTKMVEMRLFDRPGNPGEGSPTSLLDLRVDLRVRSSGRG